MAQLSADVKLRVATKELTLIEAVTEAGLAVPEWLRTGASAPAGAPVAPGRSRSAPWPDPATEHSPSSMPRRPRRSPSSATWWVGAPGDDAQPVAPRTLADARRREAKRAGEAQRKLALMQRLPSELKLRVAKREITPGGRAPRSRRRAGGTWMTTAIALDGVGGQGVRRHRRRAGRAARPDGEAGHGAVRLRLQRARLDVRRVRHLRRRPNRQPGGRGGGHHAQAGRQGAPAHQRAQGGDRSWPWPAGRRADPLRYARQRALRQGAVRQHDRAGPDHAPGADRIRRAGHP